ncbi:MAG: Gfo/Idh/MocA family protein [Gemmataceae bacterium]
MSFTSRRQFLAASAALTAAGWSRVYGAGTRLRVAAVGVGGKGWSDLTAVAASPHVEVAALCDIDESKAHLGQAATKFPHARTFTDWRKLMDAPKEFDALIVATPDHMHAPVALPALQLGKHVYCEKPLTHSVFEARQMRLAAAKHKAVTQMGNQIQSHGAYRTAVKLVHGGAIGKVKEVHSWQAGAMPWLMADDRPAGADPVPAGVHWDGWLGVAPERPFKKTIYHSFNWRGWQDFSNGQLGDFGCHILDPVFKALELTAPTAVRADAPPMNREVWAKRATVAYEFPGTKHTAGRTLKLTWYDGDGHYPAAEAHGLPAGTKLPGSGSVLIGEKGSLLIPHVAAPRLFPQDKFDKVEMLPSGDHYVGWADACRGVGATGSSFAYAGNLTEAVLLGTIAIRTPGTRLEWDAAALKLTGSDAAAALVRKPYRKGWEPAWVG